MGRVGEAATERLRAGGAAGVRAAGEAPPRGAPFASRARRSARRLKAARLRSPGAAPGHLARRPRGSQRAGNQHSTAPTRRNFMASLYNAVQFRMDPLWPSAVGRSVEVASGSTYQHERHGCRKPSVFADTGNRGASGIGWYRRYGASSKKASCAPPLVDRSRGACDGCRAPDDRVPASSQRLDGIPARRFGRSGAVRTLAGAPRLRTFFSRLQLLLH